MKAVPLGKIFLISSSSPVSCVCFNSNIFFSGIVQSYTPPGSPPSDPLGLLKPAAPPAVEASSILAALANIARQNTALPPPATPVVPALQKTDSYMTYAQRPPAQQAVAPLPIPPVLTLNVPAAPASQSQVQNNDAGAGVLNFPNNVPSAFAAPMLPSSLDPALQQTMLIIQNLQTAGMTQDQIAVVLAGMGANAQGPPPRAGPGSLPVPPPPFPFPHFNQNMNHVLQNGQAGQSDYKGSPAQNGWVVQNKEEPRDRYKNGIQDGYSFKRSRSRSPTRAWNDHSSPAGIRDGRPNYDHALPASPGQNRGRDSGRGIESYRQRSPVHRGHSPTPPRPHSSGSGGGGEKWVEYDASIGNTNIKGTANISYLFVLLIF